MVVEVGIFITVAAGVFIAAESTIFSTGIARYLVVVVTVLTNGESAGVEADRMHMGGDLVVTVTRGAAWCRVTLSAGSHKGDMELDFVSAVRGCNRSGDRARRKRGDPGSEVLHGRPNDEPAVFLQHPVTPLAAKATPDAPVELLPDAFGFDRSEDGL